MVSARIRQKMSFTPPQSDDSDAALAPQLGAAVVPPSAVPPSPPGIHGPYLCMLALFGVAQVVELCFSANVWVGTLSLGIMAATWSLHILWLHSLFLDGRRVLGDLLPLDALRVVTVTVLACVFFPLWTSIALMVLLRAAVLGHLNAAGQMRSLSPSPSSAPVAPWARDIGALVITAVLLLLSFGAELARTTEFAKLAAGPDSVVSELPPVQSLGAPLAVAVNLLELACTGYYLYWVAKSVPALYATYREITQPPQVG